MHSEQGENINIVNNKNIYNRQIKSNT